MPAPLMPPPTTSTSQTRAPPGGALRVGSLGAGAWPGEGNRIPRIDEHGRAPFVAAACSFRFVFVLVFSF